MHAGDDVDWLQMERTMPTFNEIIVTKKPDIAWDGGKATENLIPNDGDLVFDSTGGGRSAHQADELGMATDNNRDTNGGGRFALIFPTQTPFIKEGTGFEVEVDLVGFPPDPGVTPARAGPWA